jgi:hypothetical protein
MANRVATSEIVEAVHKLGVSTVLLLWLVWFLTSGVTTDMARMRAEHQVLAFHMHAICLALNREVPDRCTPPAGEGGR